MTFAFPKVPFQFSSVQHGKEGSKEGSSRSPQGDESDEGQEGVEVSAIEILAMLPPGWQIVSILDRLYFGTPLASEDLYIDTKWCDGKTWN